MTKQRMYDSAQPVHAALSQLVDDGYATDKQRHTARLALEMIEDHEEAMDQEIHRWQDAIRDKMIALGVPDTKIDGAGCDSGDPLDFTLAEVGQGLAYFIDQLEELRAPATTTQRARECAEKCAWSLDDETDGDVWETGCGQAFQFTDGGPEDNQFQFCYKCGKEIEPLRYSDSTEEE